MDRKQELERKKQKLLQMREEKRRKDESKKPTAKAELRHEAEDLLKDLGIDPMISERNIIDKLAETKIETPSSQFESKKARLKLVNAINQVDILPTEPVLYSKESQTNTEVQPRDKDNSFDYYVPSIEWDDEDLLVGKDDLLELSKFSNIPPLGKNKKPLGKGKNLRNTLQLEPDTEEFEELREQPRVPTLTDEERSQMLQSDAFLSFFNRAAKIVERAVCLNEDTHLFIRYDGGDGETEFHDSDDLVNFAVSFHDDHWSKHRSVTGLDWSPTYPELMLTSYHSNEYSQHEPEGVCLIWNMRFMGKTGPEYVFTSQSPITSACFSKFHPNIVIAGTYSGQIVLWDTRCNKRTPSQKTSLAPLSHTHRVFSVQILGTQNAHNIVSVANDGSLRNWSIENLSQPTDSAKVLEGASSGGLYDVFPTCLSFFANDLNNYAIGAENGNAYTEQRHSSRSGSRSDPVRHMPYAGHTAPINSIHCHPNPGDSVFSHLFLTSSLDWTTRLWSVRDHQPIHTFDDTFECVYDAQWSPVHPGVFATADGNGRLNIWDISSDFEVPAVSRKIGINGDETSNESHSLSHLNSGSRLALSKCRWDTTGSILAAGDIHGRVHVYNVNESLAKPKQSSWNDLTGQLADMKSLSTSDVDMKNSSFMPLSQTV